MENFLGALATIADPYFLLIILAGTVGGVLVGALPGLSSTMCSRYGGK